MAFDKTGTLTKGKFAVTAIEGHDGNEAEVLAVAAYAECVSDHPVAAAIRQAYGKELDCARVTELQETAGYGISAQLDGRRVLAGNARFLQENNIVFEPGSIMGTIVYVAAAGKFLGSIIVEDELKADAKRTIHDLAALGVTETVMLTGDNAAVGRKMAAQLGMSKVYTQLLPADKLARLEGLLADKAPQSSLAFVGDGINDAPVLARADVGIAMGGAGSDAAIEAADIVLMTDEPGKIVTAMQLARRTLRIAKQNVIFAIGVKAVILLLGAVGLATLWSAVFADVGVSMLAIMNAMRAMDVRNRRAAG
jgi:Cd2+/Zn2+-exporting ATPase